MDSYVAWQSTAPSLQKALLFMYKRQLHTDVIIQVDTPEASYSVKAHALVLASRSPIFADMFWRGDLKDTKLFKVKDVTIRGFDILLGYIYSETLDIESAEELVLAAKAARLYKIQSMIEACKNFLSQFPVDKANMFFVLEAANYLGLDAKEIGHQWLDLFQAEPLNILNNPGFLSLSEAVVRNLLTITALPTTCTFEIMLATIRWIQFNKENSKSLLSEIDISYLTSDDFLSLIETFPHFFKDEETLNILANLTRPGFCDLPSWCKFQMKSNLVKPGGLLEPNVHEYVMAHALRASTDLNKYFAKSCFFGSGSFKYTMFFEMKLCKGVHGEASVIMLELAFGSDYVPVKNLNIGVFYCEKSIYVLRKRVPYWLEETSDHYYLILGTEMKLKINNLLVFIIDIRVNGMESWDSDGPTSNNQYRVAEAPGDSCYDILLSPFNHRFVNLTPLSDWLVFVDSKSGEKKFLVTAFYFDTYKNHDKYLKRLKS